MLACVTHTHLILYNRETEYIPNKNKKEIYSSSLQKNYAMRLLTI
jgi:hypothetical protein